MAVNDTQLWILLLCRLQHTIRPPLRRTSRILGPSRAFHSSSPSSTQAKPKPPPPGRSTQSQPAQHDAPTSPKPRAQAQSLPELWSTYKWPLTGIAAVSLLFGLYFSSVALSFRRETLCADYAAAKTLPVTGRPRGLDARLAQAADTEVARRTALEFDRELDMPELLTGIRKLRRLVAAHARGHVLEVAVGTGRNLPYYEWDAVVAADADEARRLRERERVRRLLERHSWSQTVGGGSSSSSSMADLARAEGSAGAGRARELAKTLALGQVDGELLSLTAVDISTDMLRVARQHLRDTVPGLDRIMYRQRREPMPDGRARNAVGMVVDVLDHRLRLIKADAQEVLPPPPEVHGIPPPEDGKYDTVIQTFGLCSVEDPSKLLAKMAVVVRPDTGRILLLEHGRSSYELINMKLLDRFAHRHFQRYGCWWNRDIAATLEQATKEVPGLEIVSLARPNWYHAGTTMLIELKVNSASR